MLVTPRECNQVGRNSCTNAIKSIAVDPSNSSALSTLELPARDRRVSRACVESNGAGVGGGSGSAAGGGGGGDGAAAIGPVGATASVDTSITPPAWPVPNRCCASAAP